VKEQIMTESTLKLVAITAGITLLVNVWFVWSGIMTSPPYFVDRAATALGGTLVPLALGALGLLYRPNRGAGFMAVALGILALMTLGGM
jgi:hypothetical protein